MARATTTGTGTRGCALPVWQILGVCAVALTTANCSNNPQKFAGASGGSDIDPKYGVRASRRLYNEGDVIPKGGGRRFSGKPYVVAGRTYVPREDARGYVREGLASWYGSAFHGRMTANGEVFDRHSIAAAHPTLPLPSYVRVTNTANGYSMVVRVNDRGPYHANRLMDVSEEVAQALEFHRKGTAHVRVEYVGKASTAGSDDRKLLATLRTDGRPAGHAPVMVADLGPDSSPDPERFARPAKPAMAFKPEGEAVEDGPESAPAPRTVRPAPVLVASAASVAVPAALQPTAPRSAPFRPVAITPAPLSLTPPPIRLAAGPVVPKPAAPTGRIPAGRTTSVAALPVAPRAPAHSAPAPRVVAQNPMGRVQVAARGSAREGRGSALPGSAKLAMAKLAAAAAPPAPRGPAVKGGTAVAAAGGPAAKPHRSRLAEVN